MLIITIIVCCFVIAYSVLNILRRMKTNACEFTSAKYRQSTETGVLHVLEDICYLLIQKLNVN